MQASKIIVNHHLSVIHRANRRHNMTSQVPKFKSSKKFLEEFVEIELSNSNRRKIPRHDHHDWRIISLFHDGWAFHLHYIQTASNTPEMKMNLRTPHPSKPFSLPESKKKWMVGFFARFQTRRIPGLSASNLVGFQGRWITNLSIYVLWITNVYSVQI